MVLDKAWKYLVTLLQHVWSIIIGTLNVLPFSWPQLVGGEAVRLDLQPHYYRLSGIISLSVICPQPWS